VFPKARDLFTLAVFGSLAILAVLFLIPSFSSKCRCPRSRRNDRAVRIVSGWTRFVFVLGWTTPWLIAGPMAVIGAVTATSSTA
jgi:hypothetical protein